MTSPKSDTRQGASRMAEGIALQRFAESRLPDDERILSDPYAMYFIDPNLLRWAASHPAEAKALAEDMEQKMPGWGNAIRARARYFDDVVNNEASRGLEQLVILGAGYDTRAYRLDRLRTLTVFEVDRPETQHVKTDTITKILGSLPPHVAFVPADLTEDNLGQQLARAGFSRTRRTLFVMEGLVMYMPRAAVERLLSCIVQNSGPGSSVLFDYIPDWVIEGTSNTEGAKNILEYTITVGEPIRSGFAEGEVVPFLERLGCVGVNVVTRDDFRRLYFHGKNAGRPVSSLMSVASASISPPGGKQ